MGERFGGFFKGLFSRRGGQGGEGGGEPPDDDNPEQKEANFQYEVLLLLEILNKEGTMNRQTLRRKLATEMRKRKGPNAFFTTGTSLGFLKIKGYITYKDDDETVMITIKGTRALEKRELEPFFRTEEDE